MSKTLSVAAIENGTVIDHIPCGMGVLIIRLLQIVTHEAPITVGLNLTSRTHGYKDLIKMERRHLTDVELAQIAILAPNVTINEIENFKITRKRDLKRPDEIKDIFICPNPNCVTHTEPVSSHFAVYEFKKITHLRCSYCERSFAREEIKESLP